LMKPVFGCLGVDARLEELARKAPDLYAKWISSLAEVKIPPRGPRGSPQNFERVRIMSVAYFTGFEQIWEEYQARSKAA